MSEKVEICASCGALRFNDELRIAYDNLKTTVLLTCDPPDDCNDPVVLKRYMLACLVNAEKCMDIGERTES